MNPNNTFVYNTQNQLLSVQEAQATLLCQFKGIEVSINSNGSVLSQLKA